MVVITINRNQQGQVLSFHADGHAAAGEYGTDIVCAAVSAVMLTALNGLDEYLGLKERLTYKIDEDGWLYCALPENLSDDERIKTDAIVETMVIGLKVMEIDYSDHIMVEEVE